MVVYVTKAGLGPEPEFALLCRLFFRWSILVLRSHAFRHCLYCLFFRWRSGYCCAGRLASPSVTRPARPEPLSSQTRCFKVQNLTAGLEGVIWPDISHLHPLREIEFKKSAKFVHKQKSLVLTLLWSSKHKVFPTFLQNSQNLRSSRDPWRIAGIR